MKRPAARRFQTRAIDWCLALVVGVAVTAVGVGLLTGAAPGEVMSVAVVMGLVLWVMW